MLSKMYTQFSFIKHLLFIYVVTIFLLSCRKETTTYYNNHQYQPILYPSETGLPDTNRFVIPYSHPQHNGYTRFYYPNSHIQLSEGNYNNGVPSGYWKVFYSNGLLMREGNYNNGMLSGNWKFYYPNGNLKEEGNYNANLKDGYWHYYHDNGINSSNGHYTRGVKKGEWRYFNYNGVLIEAINH